MTWNYYMYYIVDLVEEKVIDEYGEDLNRARKELAHYKSLPDYVGCKLAIQQQHFISRIVK